MFTHGTYREWVCRVVLLLLSFCGSGTVHAEAIRVGGTGAALGTITLLAKEFQKREPQLVLTVVPNLGSSGSIKAVVAGAIEIALTSRPLTEEEQMQGLVAREYGKTPFVLVANNTAIKNVTLDELSAIYAGTHMQWPDGKPIRLVLRSVGDSDNEVLAKMSPAMAQALAVAQRREGMIVAATDQDAVGKIQILPGALGWASLALLLSEQRPLTPLAINGVIPSATTLADQSYPYSKTLFLVTKSQISSAVQRFVEFVQSAEGRRILAETGHWVTHE
jgi:phosphate transport system substrate-binding protein